MHSPLFAIIVAWARNTPSANAAFGELCERNPKTSYELRRRGQVENGRQVIR